ncbi:hypothetical protein [Flavobacterium sp. UBA6135]|uniref:hypothetical protein n=1 Tax=Flavobacterium sp. UBA6135 TaxID=1946553 RepID=UPI0025BC3D13|nr:hypothetical protein [Flavobacterium sp. UBA6135]
MITIEIRASFIFGTRITQILRMVTDFLRYSNSVRVWNSDGVTIVRVVNGKYLLLQAIPNTAAVSLYKQ